MPSSSTNMCHHEALKTVCSKHKSTKGDGSAGKIQEPEMRGSDTEDELQSHVSCDTCSRGSVASNASKRKITDRDGHTSNHKRVALPRPHNQAPPTSTLQQPPLQEMPQSSPAPPQAQSPAGSMSSANETSAAFSPDQNPSAMDEMSITPQEYTAQGNKASDNEARPMGDLNIINTKTGQKLKAKPSPGEHYQQASHIRDTGYDPKQPDTASMRPSAPAASIAPQALPHASTQSQTLASVHGRVDHALARADIQGPEVIYTENPPNGTSGAVAQDCQNMNVSDPSARAASRPFQFTSAPSAPLAALPTPASMSPRSPLATYGPAAKISAASESLAASSTPRVSQSALAKPSSAIPKAKISGRVNPPETGGQSPARPSETPVPARKSKAKKRRNKGRGGGIRSASREPADSQGQAGNASSGISNNRSGNSGTAAAAAAAPASASAAPAPSPAPAPAPAPAADSSKPDHTTPGQTPQSPNSNQDIPFQIPPRPLTPFRNPEYPEIDLEPRTRPISLPQLVNEVKGIYVGLAMVESKCIEIDNEQSANKDPNNKLERDQWQALMALHRTLLHEHHDFMLASQHPCASPALRRVAQKYAMPARMWRHGIHSFLELLRHRLPDAREHMISFIYSAYSIIALLYESVDAFRDTWVECLGDLSRYRMAIEEDNQRVRDTWTLVSRRWYSLASDHSPGTGRLYHHLAILARPSIVTQMYYYTKSLCVLIPFTSTHESIKTLLDPVLKGTPQRVSAAEVDYTKMHAIMFYLTSLTKQQREALYLQNDTKAAQPQPQQQQQQQQQPEPQDQSPSKTPSPVQAQAPPAQQLTSGQQLKQLHDEYANELTPTANRFMESIDEHIASSRNDWVQKGTHMAIVNSCSLLGYGCTDNVLFKLFNNAITHIPLMQDDKTDSSGAAAINKDKDMDISEHANAMADYADAQLFVARMDKAVFKRALVAKACNGYIHARLVWTLSLARISTKHMGHVEHSFPWQDLVNVLNQMLLTCASFEKIQQDTVMKPRPDPEEEQRKLLAEIKIKREEEDRNQERIFRQQQERIRLQEERERQQKQTKQHQQKDKEAEGEEEEEVEEEEIQEEVQEEEEDAMAVDPANDADAAADHPAAAPATVVPVSAKAAASALPTQQPAATATAAAIGAAAPPSSIPKPRLSMAPTSPSSARTADDETKPIPDDWALRGLVWTDSFYPKNWFLTTDSVDDDEKLLETASVAIARQDRILWAACRLAAFEKWITYDAANHKFSVAPEFVTAPSPEVSPVADQDDLDMQDALDTETTSPATMASSMSVKEDVEMQDGCTESRNGKKMAEADTEADTEAEADADADDDGLPGLEEDNDTIGSNGEDDNNDPGDDNVSLTNMQRLANQKVAKFNKEHPVAESSAAGASKGRASKSDAVDPEAGALSVAKAVPSGDGPMSGPVSELKSKEPDSDDKSMTDARDAEVISQKPANTTQ